MPVKAMAIVTRLSAAPAIITRSTPKRRISVPVKIEGPNMPIMWDEITNAAAPKSWPQASMAIGVEVIRKFITP